MATEINMRETGYYWVMMNRTNQWIVAYWSKNVKCWSLIAVNAHPKDRSLKAINENQIKPENYVFKNKN